jgi:hypothetical protein
MGGASAHDDAGADGEGSMMLGGPTSQITTRMGTPAPAAVTMKVLQEQAAAKSAVEVYELVVETWGEGVPADTCERIKNEIAEIENMPGLQEMVVKPVKDSPLHLEVRLVGWDPQSTLGQDLDVLARATGRYPAAVELVVEFASNYPASPPFVRIFTPRLQYLTGNVTFGGSFNTYYTTPDGWNGGMAISLVQVSENYY